MKKQVLAVAVIGAFAAPAAYAQTTLYGIVDVGYQHASGYDNRNKNFVQEGQHSPSRLGVRGSEDLAGGMYAMYGLEMNMPADNGTAVTLTRLAYGGLGSKAWGELTMGRQYTHTFHTYAVGSAHAYGTFASSYGWTGIPTRAGNSIKYSSPVFSGFSAGLIWSPSGQVTDEPASQAAGAATLTQKQTYWDAAVRYTPGPFGLAASIGRNKAETATTVESKMNQFAGNWDNKAFGVYGQFLTHKVETSGVGTTADQRQWSVSPVARFGSHEIYGLYGRIKEKVVSPSPEAKTWGVVFEEVMSKRTRLYAGYGKTNNQNGINLAPTNFAGAAAGQVSIAGASNNTVIAADKSVNAIQLGIVHTF